MSDHQLSGAHVLAHRSSVVVPSPSKLLQGDQIVKRKSKVELSLLLSSTVITNNK